MSNYRERISSPISPTEFLLDEDDFQYSYSSSPPSSPLSTGSTGSMDTKVPLSPRDFLERPPLFLRPPQKSKLHFQIKVFGMYGNDHIPYMFQIIRRESPDKTYQNQNSTTLYDPYDSDNSDEWNSNTPFRVVCKIPSSKITCGSFATETEANNEVRRIMKLAMKGKYIARDCVCGDIIYFPSRMCETCKSTVPGLSQWTTVDKLEPILKFYKKQRFLYHQVPKRFSSSVPYLPPPIFPLRSSLHPQVDLFE